MAGISVKNFSREKGDPTPLTLTLDQLTEQKVSYVANTTYSSVTVTRFIDALTDHVGSMAEMVDINNKEAYGSSGSSGMAAFLGDVGSSSLDAYNRRYMVAVQVDGMKPALDPVTATVTGLFNNQAYHTIGITLGLVDNTILNYLTDNTYSIQTTNHPLPKTTGTKIEDELQTARIASFVLSTNTLFGMYAPYIHFII